MAIQVLGPTYAQKLKAERPSKGQELLNAVGGAAEGGMNFLQQRQAKQLAEQQYSQENEALEKQGIHTTGVRSPELRKTLVAEGLKGQKEQSKLAGEADLEGKDYETMKTTFGKKFADVWKSSPKGAKTDLTKMAIDATLRGEDVNAILESAGISGEEPIEKEQVSPEEPVQMKNG